jgi:alkylated DNA repair dioxygenase AlkB
MNKKENHGSDFIKKELSSKSWIEIHRDSVKCSREEFLELWSVRPSRPQVISMYGKDIEIPRFQQLYGSSKYSFSGKTFEPIVEIPPLIMKCLEYVREKYPSSVWNGALVNWYPDGSSYIGPHSDDERDLEPDMPICSFCFGGVGTFRIKEKNQNKPTLSVLENRGSAIVEKLDLLTEHGSMIAMCGHMQKEYKHEITKTAKIVPPRINVTIRAFRTE